MHNKPRKWWIAGILSIFQPGLGQIYNGQANRGVWFLILPLTYIPGSIFCLNTNNIRIFLGFFILMTTVYYIGILVDAVITARKLNKEFQPKWYNKLIVYLGIVIVLFIANTLIMTYVKSNYMRAYKIPSASMEPTLLIGDHILVDRRLSGLSLNRGDLIVFGDFDKLKGDSLKRVVAISGDSVEIRDKELFINGESVREKYVIHLHSEVLPAGRNPRDNYGPVSVPPDSYFVMGDNRDSSFDSRFLGFVDHFKVKGIVKTIYWSWDRTNNSVRWTRIGTDLREPRQ